MDERAYDRIYNEGGEGYNPYRHTAEPETEYPRTEGDVIREINATGTDEHPDMVARREELRVELAEIRAAKEAEFEAEWDRETTIARRAEWNAFAATMPTVIEADRKQRELGWTMGALRRATQMHNL